MVAGPELRDIQVEMVALTTIPKPGLSNADLLAVNPGSDSSNNHCHAHFPNQKQALNPSSSNEPVF